MLIVRFRGGIGNQLFQYVFGQYLSIYKNDKVSYISSNRVLTDQIFGAFSININYAESSNFIFKLFSSDNLFYRAFRKLFSTYPFRLYYFAIENSNSSNINVFDKTYFFYDGYWQNFEYYKLLFDYHDFKISFLNRKFFDDKILNLILNSISVSIHIRRGDYLTSVNSKIYENCSMKYYCDAIQFFMKKFEIPLFFVFSNDLKWAKENLPDYLGCNYIFIDNSNTSTSALDDLFLMSKCKHNIIANSTFSLWGGLINLFESKIVIAPFKWYIGRKNCNSFKMIPSAWIRL
jgi:hypothetical protein